MKDHACAQEADSRDDALDDPAHGRRISGDGQNGER
jgi:hypothetical protein